MVNPIVEAIKKDCAKLIQNFVTQNNSQFSSFYNEYKNLKFYHIYTIQVTDTDMILTTRHILDYCKHYFNKTTISTVMEKIGALYLMYCIYYQQPQKCHVKIQVDMDTYVVMRKFIEMLDEKQNYDQIRYIFYLLLSVNAFRFVASEIFYGLEPFLCKKFNFPTLLESDINSMNFFNPEMSDLRDEEKGFCTAFKILETKYNTLKSKINEKEEVKSNRIASTNIIEEYEKELKKIEKILDIDTKDNDKKNQNENESNKKSIVVREIKKTTFSKNVSSFKKSIFDDNSIEDSTSDSEEGTDDDLDPVEKKTLKKKYSAVRILNQRLPKEVSKELGDC